MYVDGDTMSSDVHKSKRAVCALWTCFAAAQVEKDGVLMLSRNTVYDTVDKDEQTYKNEEL